MISIKKAVLHVLDSSSNIMILSKAQLEIEGDMSEYISRHIEKMIEDPNIKKARFTGNENYFQDLCKKMTDDDFLSTTSDMATGLFNLMLKHIDIPPADLIFCVFEQNNITYLGILKLNYKIGFTHWINNTDSGNINTIIKHKTLLPLESQKVDECVFIDLCTYEIMLVEKTYDINGVKECYLSNHYINCSNEMSVNQKIKILDKVANKINKKYFDEDFEKSMQIKKVVSETLDEDAVINIENVAHKAFGKNIDVRNEYVQEIEKAGLTEREIIIPEKIAEKKYSVQKIKTDTGIEINFPLEYADNKDRIEFINNPDGTIAILIKNVAKIVNR